MFSAICSRNPIKGCFMATFIVGLHGWEHVNLLGEYTFDVRGFVGNVGDIPIKQKFFYRQTSHLALR